MVKVKGAEMRACGWALMLCGLLAGGASAQSVSRKAYFACLTASAQDYDDGVSDPRSIASALLAACRLELMGNLHELSPSLDDAGITNVLAVRRDRDLDNAVFAVLFHRKRLRDQAIAPAPKP